MADDVRDAWQVSILRACSVLWTEQLSCYYYGGVDDQIDFEQRIKEITEPRVRYGYRRVDVLRRREGWAIDGKRIYRLYKQMGLGWRTHSRG